MIKSITIKNNSLGEGNKKVIELGAPETSGLWVKNIDGIGPGKADINVTDFASSDGGVYNSARSDTRNITMTLGFVPYTVDDNTYSVEDVRRDLYKWFAKKKWIEIIINLEQEVKLRDDNGNIEYKTRHIPLGCTGYVESNEPNIFNKQETTKISIICPDPNMYLYDTNGNIVSNGLNFSSTGDNFEIPMVIVRSTDSEFKKDKVYYEKQADDTYVETEDKRMLPGKKYYEEYDVTEILKDIEHWRFNGAEWERVLMPGGEDQYPVEVCHEGYENPVDVEYFLTEDTEPQKGKEYFKKIDDEYISLDDEYIPTQDDEMDDSKTYYELVSGEYVETEDSEFITGKTYYELVGFTQLWVLPVNTYEYQAITEFGKIVTIATKQTNYDGEIPVGVNITIHILGEVSGLAIYKIDPNDRYNYEVISIDDEAISLAAGGGLAAGDTIKICTTIGQKSAWLTREAEEYNIMNALGKNPDWFQLDQGDNEFSYGAISGSENVSVNIDYVKAYEGV